jgi:uncharacterized protein (TIGR02271 family)
MTRTVVGIFDDRTSANRVVDELVSNGFDRSQIEVKSHDSYLSDAASGNTGLTGRSHESHGGGIGGWFRRMFGDDDYSNYGGHYAEAVRRGGTAVCVHSNEQNADRAADILDRNGAVDIDRRAESWKQHGYKGFDANARPFNEREIESEREFHRNIPVVQEDLQVGKREVRHGGVRVVNRTHEEPVEEQVNLREEHVHVDRRPVNRPATAEDVRLADDVIEVTEMAEEPVVTKNTRVVEEVVVGKTTNQRTQTIRDTVKRTEVNVERLGDADYDTDFRNDFRTRYGSMPNAQYETYEPAYQYGYRMALDKRYHGRRWEDVEPDLRRDYARSYPNSKWEQMKDSVRYGWNKVTGRM